MRSEFGELLLASIMETAERMHDHVLNSGFTTEYAGGKVILFHGKRYWKRERRKARMKRKRRRGW